MDNKLVDLIKSGGVAVIPTDTIYGIVGSALNPHTVEKIYKLRKRNLDKPFIILISSLDDLKKFEVKLTEKQQDFLTSHWPNPLSVVLPVNNKKFNYLHRGINALAFRFPKDERLVEVLKNTGPLVVPSANLEGEKPSETIKKAQGFFGKKVAFYVDGGRINSSPSTLVKLEEDGSVKILRKGNFLP